MANITVWKFDSVDGAGQALEVLKGCQDRQLIVIQDGAIVTWEEGKKKPTTEQLNRVGRAGALSGGFWGMLFGLLFFIPLIGLAVGAATGALMAHFSDYGIDDDFIKSVQKEVVPGTSALFLLAVSSASDKVIAEVKAAGLAPELIESNMTVAQEDKLKAAFADD